MRFGQGRLSGLALIRLRRGDIGIPQQRACSELAAKGTADDGRLSYLASSQVLRASLL